MLVEFQVTNFRSFRDTQRLSMVASADASLPENTIGISALGKQRLLRSTVIYGANAAGKSNLLAALESLRSLIVNFEHRIPGSPLPLQPFKLDGQHEQAVTTFELTFIQGGVRYQYGLALDRRIIREEWLIAYPSGLPQRWFSRRWDAERERHDWHFGSKLKGPKRDLEALTRADTPFLAVAPKFNQQQLTEVYGWFEKQLRLITHAHNDASLYEAHTAELAAQDPELRRDLAALLRRADLGIADFSAEERQFLPGIYVGDEPLDETVKQVLARKSWVVEMQHRGGTGAAGTAVLSMEEESLGTRRLFGLASYLLLALRHGGVLCIDEIDASLHPNLVRHIVRLFHDPVANVGNAQLLFNTHDTTLLDSGLFRRDQIWFVEKDNAGASQLYPLLEYSPRKDEALARGYLRGRYGAIPFLRGTPPEFVTDAQE